MNRKFMVDITIYIFVYIVRYREDGSNRLSCSNQLIKISIRLGYEIYNINYICVIYNA